MADIRQPVSAGPMCSASNLPSAAEVSFTALVCVGAALLLALPFWAIDGKAKNDYILCFLVKE